ncbi:hypothetical protein [Lacrimispora amygdalina]|uniref:hypothetical protein n=1 Tax=Lacrimispora amygdalina TaxID=253257 RepID=UPI000BE23B88|nr:hypothetical protein [Lacrimispora amygdalina]
MKKSDLEQGMLIQTTHNRYGFVELDRNRIHICYDPDCIRDEDQRFEMLPLDDVYEYGDDQIGVGFILDKETKEKYPDAWEDYEIGDLVIGYEIVAVYKFVQVYDNGVGVYPPIIL